MAPTTAIPPAQRMRCPACQSARTRLAPTSRATGDRVLVCRDCGLRALADRSKYAMSTEEFAAHAANYDYEQYVNALRDLKDERMEVLQSIRDRLGDRDKPSLFDIGAGDGAFCVMARDFGFEVAGNDILPEAVDLARERNGVDLMLGTLDELGLEGTHDAITMWCVLAHVEDVDDLVARSFALLKPGGVLFLQTPHRCIIDHAALATLRASRGRVSKLVDARIGRKHWQLHTGRSITALLERHGFTDVAPTSRPRYSLTSKAYFQALHAPAPLVEPAAKAADLAIRRGWMPHIVLDVLARKPE